MIRLSGAVATACGLMLSIAASFPVNAAVLTHEWLLNGTTADTLGGPNMVLAGGTLGPAGYTFGLGQGPSVSGAISTTNYSIEMLVTIANLSSGYRWVIDFKNGTTDQGQYFLNGQANFYSNTGNVGPVFSANVPLHIVATRDGGTGLYSFYVNGGQALSFNDSVLDRATFTGPGAIVRLLRDDGGEHPSGFLDYVRFYDGALTSGEVNTLFTTGIPPSSSAPAPAALALLGLGFLGFGLLRRRVVTG